MKPINLLLLLPHSRRVLLELRMPDPIDGYRTVRKDRIPYPRRKCRDLGVVVHPQVVVGIRDPLPIYFRRIGNVTEHVGTVRGPDKAYWLGSWEMKKLWIQKTALDHTVFQMVDVAPPNEAILRQTDERQNLRISRNRLKGGGQLL